MRAVARLLLAAALLAVAACAYDEPLPEAFVGHWVVNSSLLAKTVVGPLTNFNFTISVVPGFNGTRWIMRHHFTNQYELSSAKQQFWVTSSGHGASATSNLTYCGELEDFFVYGQPQPVETNFTQVNRSSTMLAWMPFWQFTGLWKLELLDAQTLHSHFQMPDGTADHLDAVYTKVSSDPLPYLDEATRAHLLRVGASPNFFNGPCNWTLPSPTQFPAANAAFGEPALPAGGMHHRPATLPHHHTGKIPKTETKRGCPFGFGGRKKQQQPQQLQHVADAPSNGSGVVMPEAAERLGAQYQHCYFINEAMQFVVAWNWNVDSETVNIAVSAAAPEGKEASSQYVAVGFNPAWPLMQGMDIVMGYAGAADASMCVRSMYALYDVGTPVDNAQQQITPQFLGFNLTTNTIEMRFDRPWKTGHRNLASPWTETDGVPNVAFAVGDAAANCTARPHYHWGFRGVYGMLWDQPSVTFPDHMRCVPPKRV